jgi:hypothetical protein
MKKLILFIILLAFNLSSDLNSQPNVLILEDGGTEDSVYAILNRTGLFNLTLGGSYYTYTGADINNYNVIIFLNGIEWSFSMADSVQQKIVNRVSQGAGLFTIEWVSWNASFGIIENIIPVTTNGTYTENTTETLTKLAASHPIANSLPASFPLAGLHALTLEARDSNPVKQAETVFQGSWSGSAVTAGVWNNGKTTHWSSAGHYSSTGIWDNNSRTMLVNIVRYLAGIPTGINQQSEIPRGYSLSQNYPNPFNPSTKINFSIPAGGIVTVKIFNALGMELETLINSNLNRGAYGIEWNAEKYSSGVYYYKISAGEFAYTKKMILLK